MKFERHLDAEVVSMLSLSDGYVLPLTLSCPYPSNVHHYRCTTRGLVLTYIHPNFASCTSILTVFTFKKNILKI